MRNVDPSPANISPSPVAVLLIELNNSKDTKYNDTSVAVKAT